MKRQVGGNERVEVVGGAGGGHRIEVVGDGIHLFLRGALSGQRRGIRLEDAAQLDQLLGGLRVPRRC